MGKRPLPGRGKSRRLRPGISKHPGRRWGDGSTSMWDSLRHLFVFLWDSPPSEAVNARAHRGVKSCRRKLKNDEVVALWMMGRRLKISGAKKGRGMGGGAGRMPTRNIPHHLFLAQSEYLLVETPAATSAPRAL